MDEPHLTKVKAFYRCPVFTVIEALLESGANKGLRDANGQTALEYFQNIEIEKYQNYDHCKGYAEIKSQCIALLRQQ